MASTQRPIRAPSTVEGAQDHSLEYSSISQNTPYFLDRSRTMGCRADLHASGARSDPDTVLCAACRKYARRMKTRDERAPRKGHTGTTLPPRLPRQALRLTAPCLPYSAVARRSMVETGHEAAVEKQVHALLRGSRAHRLLSISHHDKYRKLPESRMGDSRGNWRSGSGIKDDEDDEEGDSYARARVGQRVPRKVSHNGKRRKMYQVLADARGVEPGRVHRQSLAAR